MGVESGWKRCVHRAARRCLFTPPATLAAAHGLHRHYSAHLVPTTLFTSRLYSVRSRIFFALHKQFLSGRVFGPLRRHFFLIQGIRTYPRNVPAACAVVAALYATRAVSALVGRSAAAPSAAVTATIASPASFFWPSSTAAASCHAALPAGLRSHSPESA
jgi:hypothetical protein